MKQLIAMRRIQPSVNWVKTFAEHMSAREKAILTLLAIAFVASTAFSIIGFIQRNSHLVAQEGGVYTEAAVGQPRNINPILAGANDLDLDITYLIYSSLFRLNNELELEGDLATNYEIADNNRVYTIHLRDDIKWHDGEQFTADDVIFTIRSIQTPDYGSPLATAFQSVKAEKIDDFTVKFTLQQPYAPFIYSLTLGITPEHVWESIPPKNAALAEQMLRPVGTGPFKFEEIITRRKTGEITEFKMTRNEEYYGQRPYLDEFTYIFFQTHEEAVQALMTGNADGVGFIPLSLAEDARNRKSIDVHRLLLPQYFGLFLNEIKNEQLGDAGIRSALNLGINRDKIVSEAFKGEAESLRAPIPSGIFNFTDDLNIQSYNQETAKQNLEEAGWKDEDGDGIREKDDKQLHVTITTTDWPEYVKTAEVIQTQWQEIGVSVDIEHFSTGTIQQTIVGPRDYEILLYGENLPVDPDPYPFWHSTQTRNPGLNLSLFKDEKTDKLLEEARKTFDPAERRDKYLQFQQRFLDLNPAIILYRPYYLFAQKTSVRGEKMENVDLPHSRYNNIEEWHVLTKRIWGENNE